MEKNRLGIFVFYDEDGIVDEYVFYLLGDLCQNLQDLIIIINGNIQSQYEERFKSLTSYIVYRENKGFDAAAFKFALTKYLKWEKIAEYDELVLVNDTFFGPLYPLKEVFASMEPKKYDFWGLTCHYEVSDVFGTCPYGYIPAHIQSYFMVIDRKMHGDASFRLYWEQLEIPSTFEEAVGIHEAVFTKHFEERGFSWGVYVDTEYCKSKDRSNNYNAYAIDPYILLSQKSMPVLKRKNFTFPLTDTLSYNRGNEMHNCMEFIKKNTSYDTNLIWQNVLRKYNIYDIFNTLGLQYILPDDYIIGENNMCGKVLVVLHIFYADDSVALAKYINSIPASIDLLVTTSSEVKCQRIKDVCRVKKLKFMVVPNRGRDVSSLLVAIREEVRKYEYLCFCHDKKTSRYALPVGREFQELMWENLLANSTYIQNVLSLFIKEKKLGLLAPPSPFHGGYRALLGNRWTVNYNSVEVLLAKIGVRVPLEKSKMPLTMGTAFWCRTEALRKLWSYPWKYDMFPSEPILSDGELNHAVERSLAYVAQEAGFYTAWGMTPRQAVLEARNSRHTIEQMIQRMEAENALLHEGDQSRQLIIYGAGNWGQMAFERYQGEWDILFFVDRDNKKHGRQMCGRNICHPSAIGNHDKAVIMIAVEKSDGIESFIRQKFPGNKIMIFHPLGTLLK